MESVIVDEGFGSLDQDGLQRMADELHRLKEESNLKRVLLVSHQEAFTARFPVGYELRPGGAGTVAQLRTGWSSQPCRTKATSPVEG